MLYRHRLLTGLVQNYLSETLHYHYWKVHSISEMLKKVIILLPAALEIPEVMPTADQQDGVDKEWQRWLQELFCCGKLLVKKGVDFSLIAAA